MNSAFAFCAIAIVGWGSPDLDAPTSTQRQTQPSQALRSQQYPSQTTAPRQDRSYVGMPIRAPQRMPLPPTDPRAFVGDNLPLPPTMNDAGTVPGEGMVGMPPRRDFQAANDSGDHRYRTSRPFDHYRQGPTVSPYQLLDASTGGGTVNTYMAYVRPMQEQQRAVQDYDRMEAAGDQPAPVYPRVFQNYGSYYPQYSAAR